MDALELQKQLRLKLDGFSVALAPYSQYHDPQSYRLYAAVSFSALEAKLPEAVRLATQILTQTDFPTRQSCWNSSASSATDSSSRLSILVRALRCSALLLH